MQECESRPEVFSAAAPFTSQEPWLYGVRYDHLEASHAKVRREDSGLPSLSINPLYAQVLNCFIGFLDSLLHPVSISKPLKAAHL